MGVSDFRTKVRHAVFWRSGAQIAQQTVQWALTLLVIRLLHPEDYGLIAMTDVVTAFLTIIAAQGLSSAIVQAPTFESRQTGQFLGLLILVNLSLAGLQIALAPVVADFYRSPIVAQILTVQAINYLFLPFIALPSALASRNMDFRSTSIVHFSATTGSGVVVLAMAWSGYGVWALVTGTIILHAIRAIGMQLILRWFVRPEFRFDGLGPMIRFGATIMLNAMLWIVYAQSDIFFAGRMLPPREVGLYAEALLLAMMPVVKFIPVLNGH